MYNNNALLRRLGMALGLMAASMMASADKAGKPNFLLIVADDLGDSQPEIVLAAKVMVERPFGYTGGGQHGINTRGAEAFLTNQVCAGVDDVIAGVVRCHGWYIRPVV